LDSAEKRGGKMILGLFLIPFMAGLLAFLIRPDYFRRTMLVVAAGIHFIMMVLCWRVSPATVLNGWFSLDPLGTLFLGITSLLFFAAVIYGVQYLAREKHHPGDREEGFLFNNAPEAVFTGCLLIFLAAMTLVVVSHNFGILWVAMEATTLVSAPLIYFHRQHRSLEATWKYLLICSVGIALALLGNLFLVVTEGEGRSSLLLLDLIRNGRSLNIPWLKAAFIFLFVGYGTKMGLAPMHTWLPDAHSEAPSVVSALLSGALLNCAFLCILRVFQVCVAAGLERFCQDLFTLFGFFSMFFATIFIFGQTDYKRMLAYSSIEHMGILSLGMGLGGAAIYGAMLHAVNHSLTKAGLFFTAGNILSQYRTKAVKEVQGICPAFPKTGILWMAGFFAITGTPPFGVFLSKFIILKAALDQGHFGQAAIFLAILSAIFIGVVRIFVPMAQGTPPENLKRQLRPEPILSLLPTLVLLGLVLIQGIYVPPALNKVLNGAAQLLVNNP
jgi:hydrogenase-4 component F